MSCAIQTVTDAEGEWIKASFSGGGNDCVEIDKKRSKLRDTKSRGRGHLELTPEMCAALFASIRQIAAKA